MLTLKVSITEDRSGWDMFAKKLSQLQKKEAKVGVQSSEDSELLMIANVNEFGAEIDHPGGTKYILLESGMVKFVSNDHKSGIAGVTKPHKIIIPERPFLRQTFDKYQKELLDIGFDLGNLVLEGKLTTKKAFELWGDKFISMIRSEVAEGNNFEPNAPATIKRKGAGLHPLQETGRLMQSLKTVMIEA